LSSGCCAARSMLSAIIVFLFFAPHCCLCPARCLLLSLPFPNGLFFAFLFFLLPTVRLSLFRLRACCCVAPLSLLSLLLAMLT
jgi:hypothetical protein